MSELFRSDFGMTELAGRLTDDVHMSLQRIFKRYVEMGCSPRDVGYIVMTQVPLVDMEFRRPYNLGNKIKVTPK